MVNTTTSNTSNSNSGGCPYAAAPVCPNNEDDDTSVSSMEVGQAIELAKTSCPAFANHSCPFSKSEDIQKTIATMPPSHVSIPATTSHCVRLALQHVHTISHTNKEEKYALPMELLEGLSFNAVLTKLIQQEEEEEEEVASSDGGVKERKMSLSLSSALKVGTAESHSAAESVHFVKNFAKGIIDRDLFATLTSNLMFVYQTLERLLEEHAPGHFPSLHFPQELERLEALTDDVEFFLGDTSQLKPSPATQDYMDRMEHVAKTEPLLLLSHAYTRYLGDLSGGRILSRVARKALSLEKDGLRFYHFDNIRNPKQFKDNYRLQLDQLAHVNMAQMERVVAEANVAFVLNMRMFEELDVQSGMGHSVRPLSEATQYYDRCLLQQQQPTHQSPLSTLNTENNKCPFANLGGPNPHPVKKEPPKPTERCPWPFVFFHDPATGMKDYQTWVVLGILLSYIWSIIQQQQQS